MPFTVSHAVVALPLRRTPLSPAAIAVGAMTPDLPLFVRGTPITYAATHSFGMLPATVLVALALLLLWRVVLRPATRELAPRWLAERLPATWDGAAHPGAGRACLRTPASEMAGMLLLAASLAIGVATHIVWDLFTHDGRLGVALIPALEDRWGPFAGYRWLQHGSSVMDLAVLTAWAALWLRRRMPAPVRRVVPGGLRAGWWASLPAALLIAWCGGVGAFGPFTAQWTPEQLAYRVIPPACAVWGLLTLLVCVLVQIRQRRR